MESSNIDPVLLALNAAINNSAENISIPLTLLVSGNIIQADLIGKKEYFKDISESILDDNLKNFVTPVVAKIEDSSEQCLCLREVEMLGINRELFRPLMRISISDVTGFSIGRI